MEKKVTKREKTSKKESFLEKNLKYITIVLLVLFLFKSMQSCNRGSKIDKLSNTIEYVEDSLNIAHELEIKYLHKSLDNARDSIKTLNYQVLLANDRVTSANKMAAAVQNTAEKIKANTTIKVENYQSTDSTSIK